MRRPRYERRRSDARPARALEAQRARLDRDGIAPGVALLDPPVADALYADFTRLFARALAYPGGTVNRGPERHYFAVAPEELSAFLPILETPTVLALSGAVLGPEWALVEVGFDVPRPGALHQRWHRDFPTPPRSAAEHALSSLAFNVATLDVTPALGPFEIAPGTQWDDGQGWEAGMFPPRELWPRYEALRTRMFARRGEVTVRTGLTVHRGTPNTSTVDRGVLVLGAVAPDDPTPAHHRLRVTRRFFASLPDALRAHLRVELVDVLPERPVQAHHIEGLVDASPRY